MNRLLKKYPDEITRILAKYPPEHKAAAVMPLLHLAQAEAGFVSRAAMLDIAEISGLSITEVASVVGFYTLFHETPQGKIHLQVCTDVACDLRGAKEYLSSLCDQLGIKPDETSPDGLITIEEVKCLAACDRAPLFQAQIGDEIEYHENQTPPRTIDWLRSMSAALTGKTLQTNTPVETKPVEGGSHE
jgi:NADH-quinone oxidoreductase subunit E